MLKRNLVDVCFKQNVDAPKMAASKSIVINGSIYISIEAHLNTISMVLIKYQFDVVIYNVLALNMRHCII